MSIATLNQVYDETRRLAIAGSNLSAGDFRLKKLVVPLREAATRAPVFGQVATAVEKVVAAPPKESAQALVELSSLVLAILYTQGKTQIEGELQPIESLDLSLGGTQVSSKQLRALVDALTKTGSGRLEVVKEAWKRGDFRDVRTVHAAVAALVDPYSELADFVADRVIPLYGATVSRLIMKQYRGAERGRARCLRVLARAAPDETRPIALEALDSGTKEIKVAALRCLGGYEDDLAILHEYAKSRAKEIRRTAFERLAPFDDETTAELFRSALSSSDLENVVDAIARNRNETLLTLIHETIEREAEQLTRERTSTSNDPVGHFVVILRALEGRNDRESLNLVRTLFGQRAAFRRLQNTSDGEIIVEALAQLMHVSNDAELQRALVDARDEMGARAFQACALAGLAALEPGEFYRVFAPYYKRGKQREVRCETLLNMLRNQKEEGDHNADAPLLPREALDPQWLSDAIKKDDFDTVHSLAIRGHHELHEYLTRTFARTNRRRGFSEQVCGVVALMLDTQHPDAVQTWIEAAKGTRSDDLSKWYLLSMVQFMSVAEVDRVEEALSEYPEHMVDDVLEELGTCKDAIRTKRNGSA